MKIKNLIKYLYGCCIYYYRTHIKTKENDKEEIQPEVKDETINLLPFIGDEIRLRINNEMFDCLNYYVKSYYDVDGRYIDGTIGRSLMGADIEVYLSMKDFERFSKVPRETQYIEILDFPYYLKARSYIGDIKIDLSSFTVKFYANSDCIRKTIALK